MSTLVVSNIETTDVEATGNITDGTTTVSTGNVLAGIAKARNNVNQQGTQSIRGSLNISSITDMGTGDTRHTFTNAWANTNYTALTSGGRGNGSDNATDIAPWSDTPSTTQFRQFAGQVSGAANDGYAVYLAVFGDLA